MSDQRTNPRSWLTSTQLAFLRSFDAWEDLWLTLDLHPSHGLGAMSDVTGYEWVHSVRHDLGYRVDRASWASLRLDG